MYTKLKNSKTTLVTIVILLAAVLLVAVLGVDGGVLFKADKILYNVDDYGYVTPDSIFLRTDRTIYVEHEIMIGMLVNLSSHAIEIRDHEPLIYELSEFGWKPPIGTIWTMLAYSSPHEKGWVQSGDVLPISMGFFRAKTVAEVPRWNILEGQYFHNGNEYVVYSNELVISESSQSSRFRTPPTDIINAPNVRTEVVEPYVVSLTNNSGKALWFNSICSSVNPNDYSTNDLINFYPLYAILQKQSGEGTWQVLRPNKEQCTAVSAPIRIDHKETVQFFLRDGYPASHELDPGVYRWHLVNYIDPFPECNPRPGCFFSGAHLFTETFEP